MSDRIAVMRAGRFVQVGTPDEIYSRPANRFVAEFIGDVNVFGVKKNAKGRLGPGRRRQPRHDRAAAGA